MRQIDIPAARKMCQDLPVIKERLHRIGLHGTANKMEAAVYAIGFEVAHHIEVERKKLEDPTE